MARVSSSDKAQAIRFDPKSAIRERLALLAAQGPQDCADWSYDPRFDRWYRFERGGAVRRVDVKQEGSASLYIIITKWALNRQDAMALIGYPER